MEDVRTELDRIIKQEIINIGGLQTASGEKGAAIDDLVKLYNLRIQESKYITEACEKTDARLMDDREKTEARFMENAREEKEKEALLIEQTKDRYVKIGIAMAEIVLPLGFYAIWMKRGFKFEETGAFTSTTFKGLIGKFKPTKK